jgi:hypothetical protein
MLTNGDRLLDLGGAAGRAQDRASSSAGTRKFNCSTDDTFTMEALVTVFFGNDEVRWVMRVAQWAKTSGQRV